MSDGPDLPPADAAAAADAAHPVRLAIADALARRAEQLHGEARQHALQRAAAMRARPGHDVAPMSPVHPPLPRNGLEALSGLIDRLGRSAPVHTGPLNVPATGTAAGPAPAAQAPAVVPLSRTANPSPLKAVSAFQGTWSRLRVAQRLRQALAQVPASAGPLNSSHIINRTLQALQELSPAYLDAFMSHVDTLHALEQLVVSDMPEAPAPARRKAGGRASR